MNAPAVQLLRILLYSLASSLATRGWLAADQTELFVGTGIGLATLLWWSIANRRRS